MRMGASIALAASTFFVALAACAEEASDAAQWSAHAFNGCTQEDAPALIIRLDPVAKDKAPIQFEIAGVEGATVPLTIALSPLRRENIESRIFARAAYVDRAEPRFLSGEVLITALEIDERVSGTYTVTLAQGGTDHGAFDAAWKPGAAVCGG